MNGWAKKADGRAEKGAGTFCAQHLEARSGKRCLSPFPPAKPVVTVVHSLPGRVRVRLSVVPRDAQRLLAGVRGHPGMESISFSPRTRSVLACFDPREISQEEIVLRVAFYLSLDCAAVPVRLLAEPEQPPPLGASAGVAAALVAAALLMRGRGARGEMQPPAALSALVSPLPLRWDWLAGLGTAWAVVAHGVSEFRERGTFDPEVLTLAYLLSAFARGNLAGAAAVTWLASFGRHLVAPPAAGVQVRPIEVRGSTDGEPRYEVLIGPDVDAPQRIRILDALQSILRYAATGGGTHGLRSLLDELRQVSRVHGEVLEGFGPVRQGIPIRFD